MVGEKRILIQMITERKKNCLGHVLRGEGLLKVVIDDRMIGKRPRERKNFAMQDLIETATEK